MASDSNPGPLKELATSRARFIAELGERLAAIRQGLARVGAAGLEASAELNAVRRRLHALAAAADVLHFTAAADALRRAELELSTLAGAPSAAPTRERVVRVLDLVPSLALGAAIDVQEELEGERTRSPRVPLCVLVYGDVALESALHKPGPLHAAETHLTRDLDELLTLVTRLGPDVLLVDGDDPQFVDFLPRLRQAAAPSRFTCVAVGNFEAYDGLLRLIRRGVSRVLPKPVDAASLQRTLRVLVPREPPAPPRPNPFTRPGPDGLVDVIGTEARRAFVDPHSGAVHAPAFSVDAGTQALAALWSAFARIRALAARASDSAPRIALEGPHGMIPLAPALAEGPAPSPRGSAVAEALAGRRFVVADADPTLLGALSRSLQRLGASVLPARDGAQALELCERHWPDALISDALLPGIDGFELCRRLRDDVALGDLPVALICWKEHLIEHVRRSSEQHGSEPRPLDPEAFAPLAEGLQRRIQLERRLERHDAVHGRLDGLTPRLLLQLACSRTPSAVLSVRTGHLSAEVAVVDGRPVHARLLDTGAVAVEGPAALGAFLGVRMGRFSLEPLSAAPAAHFSGDVMTVLAPSIARARRARVWLANSDLVELERVELEPRVAALHADEAPVAERALTTRLLRGESPRHLTDLSEPADPGASALGRLLLELVRRGGVLALIDRTGRDVLEPDSGRPSAVSRPRAETPAVPLPAALSLAEAVLQAVSAPTDYSPDRPSARRTHPGLAPPSPPPEPLHPRKPRTPPLPDALISADARPSSIPAEPRSSAVPPEPRSSAERSSRVPAEPRSSRIPPAPRSSWIPPDPRSSAERSSRIPPAPRASWIPPEPRSSAEPRSSRIPPAPRSSWLPPEPRSAEPRSSRIPPAPRSSWLPPEPHAGATPEARRPSYVPPAPRSSVVPAEPRAEASQDARRSSVPAEARPSQLPPEPRRSLIPPAPREVTEAWSSEPYAEEETDPGPASSGDASHSLDEDPGLPSGGRARAVAGPVLVMLASAALALIGIRVILGGTLDRLASSPTAGTLARVSSLEPLDSGVPQRSPAYHLGSDGTTPSTAETESLDARDAGAPARASEPLEVKVSTELLDPPPQPRLVPGHGLLEVRTWEPQRIYVDGVFVGNYSSRLVPLSPGTYHVRMAGARDIEQSVQVEAGRRTRVWARTASGE